MGNVKVIVRASDYERAELCLKKTSKMTMTTMKKTMTVDPYDDDR